jgi:hypothetical protein
VRVCLFVRAGIGPWRCVAVGANPMFNSPSFALTMTDPQKERKLDRSFKLLASSHSLLEPAWLAGPSGFLESIFIDRATLNGTRPNSP